MEDMNKMQYIVEIDFHFIFLLEHLIATKVNVHCYCYYISLSLSLKYV